MTYKSWIDVGTKTGATFLTVSAAATTDVKWHDNAIAFLKELGRIMSYFVFWWVAVVLGLR